MITIGMLTAAAMTVALVPEFAGDGVVDKENGVEVGVKDEACNVWDVGTELAIDGPDAAELSEVLKLLRTVAEVSEADTAVGYMSA
jgi:hypothetical protein